MPLSIGERLGPYEILASIGAGGMGEVYKARDTRLDRIVAIKVSQEQFSERFEREARAVAALNHPNICHLYDVGPNYLVMEYIDGSPIAAGDDPRKLLDLAAQVADGMAAAHAAGIVHRDLKPDNILVTREGRVKILDFGLAKQSRADNVPEDATRTIALTDPGATVGTVNYMSPEQARGEQNLTTQSDQFAFGLVLYEMLAGKRAFQRGSRAETMTAIIREDADPLPASAPAPLKWVIARLLAKDPLDRYDSSRDLYRELRQIRERLSEATSASQAVPVAVARPKRRVLPWAMLAAGLATGAAAVFLVPKPPVAVPDLSGYKFTPISRDAATEREPSWSPDGKSIVYTASINGVLQVFTRALGSSEAAQITRVDKAVRAPRWSPDASTIYYNSDNSIWAVGATGGTPERVFERAGVFSIHPDGKTFFSFGRNEFQIGSPGGKVQDFPLPKELSELRGNRTMIGFSPDGSKLALIGAGDLWVLPYPSLGESGKFQRFPVGDARAGSWMPDSRRLVLEQDEADSYALSLLDTANGSRRTIYSSPDAILSPSVSRDGKRIVYATGRFDWKPLDIGIQDGRIRALRAAGGNSWFPAWAPSGTHYLYATNSSGHWTIEDASANGDFSRRVAEVESATSLSVPYWAPDGARFSFLWSAPSGGKLMLSNASGGRMVPLDPNAPGSTGGAVWSPDGQWIVYTRTLRATQEAQVARIRPGAGGQPEILATYGASNPELLRVPLDWSPTGEWVLAAGTGTGGSSYFLVSPDFTKERKLTSRVFFNQLTAGFSKDGRQVLAVLHNTSGQGVEWQLFSYDVATGAERKVADLDLPVTTGDLRGFSRNPDGKSFAAAIANWPYDIWMLEGFDTK